MKTLEKTKVKPEGTRAPRFECHLTARGYEMDSFGHINNAVYLNYLEQARWEICHQAGWLRDYFEDRKLFLVVVETWMRYIKESKIFDALTVNTDIEIEPPYLIFHHCIFRVPGNEKIMKATVKTIFVDQQRVSHDVPEGVIKFLRDANDENRKTALQL